MLFGFIVVIICLVVLRNVMKADEPKQAEKAGELGQAAKADKRLRPPAVPGRNLDPYDVYDVCFALAYLAASTGDDSIVTVYLNDKSEKMSAGILVFAGIDEDRLTYGNPCTDYKAIEFYSGKLLLLASDMAQFLTQIPFDKVEFGTFIGYYFYDKRLRNDYPVTCNLAEHFVEEMKKGFEVSEAARLHHHCYDFENIEPHYVKFRVK